MLDNRDEGKPRPTNKPGHFPTRPGWTCSLDGQPWPCHTQRLAYLEEFGSGGMARLGILMRSYYDEAVTHDPGRGHDLYRQFIGWVIR